LQLSLAQNFEISPDCLGALLLNLYWLVTVVKDLETEPWHGEHSIHDFLEVCDWDQIIVAL
jgi:hypothetical protein